MNDTRAQHEHEALSQHIDAMTRLLLASGDITAHAALMFRRVVDQHRIETTNEASSNDA